MILECFQPTVARAEQLAGQDPASALAALRELPLDDFGLLLLDMPRADLPALSAVLPRMADPQVQRNWTGSDGITLLGQSLSFVRIVSRAYTELTGKTLHQKRILDFGVGWGRLVRLMYHYSDPDLIHGCDPWDLSLDICRKDGLLCHLAQSDYLPTSLPFEGRFDLIYAFSVFTHLSQRATASALAVLERHLAAEGVLVVTIRPLEYWNVHQPLEQAERDRLMALHRSARFAYRPHNRDAVDGDVTYGDTSMAFDWLQEQVPGLRIRRFDRSLTDPFQLIVTLTR
ncbi:class I SAM-dependent methyltransferase [Phreatobacter aquaticus]|uniref:Class I SAM-dependent methyltransferase n=1 Tax=Phreatobacter aquaticus TaxID=2570229 RepID=A0A4D7QW46_9HYPH|nr:class I SAM-dependent methyltransferase [Phreatobacter aquaticus]QCK88182.1 class I SAM-dependent methyltransferase [Phreatobacter aquaticus]